MKKQNFLKEIQQAACLQDDVKALWDEAVKADESDRRFLQIEEHDAIGTGKLAFGLVTREEIAAQKPASRDYDAEYAAKKAEMKERKAINAAMVEILTAAKVEGKSLTGQDITDALKAKGFKV